MSGFTQAAATGSSAIMGVLIAHVHRRHAIPVHMACTCLSLRLRHSVYIP